MNTLPIIEFFDDEPVITPAKFHAGAECKIKPQIKTAICTFMCENIDRALLKSILDDSQFLYYVYGRSGKVPIYQYREQCLIVLMTVGAPVAAAVVEELKYLGIENIIAYGTAGRLDDNLPADTLVVIDKAIRDEGTSYHYCAPSLYIDTDVMLSDTLANFLNDKGKVVRGITWTTDALFRETGLRVSKRRTQGAVVVEMECAAFAAAAQRLGMRFAEFVFFSDSLTNDQNWQWVGDINEQSARRSLKAAFLTALSAWCPKIKLPKRQ